MITICPLVASRTAPFARSTSTTCSPGCTSVRARAGVNGTFAASDSLARRDCATIAPATLRTSATQTPAAQPRRTSTARAAGTDDAIHAARSKLGRNSATVPVCAHSKGRREPRHARRRRMNDAST